MGLLDRLRSYLNDDATGSRGGGSGYRAQATRRPAGGARSEDEIAVDRYRYLLRTAPPDAVEEVHAEAFAKLTPQQRRLVFEELSQNAAAADRPASDDPRTLARSATRSELRQPGFLERTLGSGAGGGMSRGPGLGTMIGGSLLGTVAGVVIGSAIADMVLPGIGDFASDFGDGAADLADAGGDFASGADDFGGGGFGDFGGGDGGGFGDFGGGDF
ncbi:hypothetical protein GCM10025783_17230 [Amnibacterium soli]|uniref:Cation-transporting ATPase n=1 Tax=Amnibacterium soli TaxID=1282736 RepID=A0ABP8Z465_9MICO